MKKIKGAVIGLGYWGPNIVRNLQKIPQVEISWVCDISVASKKKVNKEYPFLRFTNSIDDIIGDPDVHFISIATPTHTHFPLALKALVAGKHVLIEKPLTHTSDQARELIKVAKQNKRILMVGHTFVYAGAIRKIKKSIMRDSFGSPSYYESIRINLGRIQSDSNVIWDLAPHDLSILDYLIPYKPLSVQAIGTSSIMKKQIDQAHIFITYENNFTAHIFVSWLSPVKIRTVLLGGSKQMIQYNDIEPSEKVRIYNSSILFDQKKITPFTPAYRSGSVIIPHLDQKEPLLTELEHFIECIKNNSKPLTGGEQGMKVVQLLEATDRSLASNKSIPLSL